MDIQNRKDIITLVDSFYEKVLKDELLGRIFTNVVKVDWEKHLPRMYDFWETTLFYESKYSGNPMQVHVDLNQRFPLTKVHFDRWLALFNQTVDELFEGNMATLARQRALSIATVMQVKIYAADTHS